MHCCAMTSPSGTVAISAEAVVRIARGWIGVPFRPQGRDRLGVDCVGLVAAIWAEAGRELRLPADYSLGRTPCARVAAGLAQRGFMSLPADGARAGDVLLMEPAPGRSHVGLCGGGTVIEADARAGRVVERRRAIGEMWLSAWRYSWWTD